MNDEENSPDNALVSAALEHPMSRYLEWAERPDVAHALSMFKSEHEIRKTGRLDLVTWVQYICAFGYDGPADNAWAALFAACRVIPMLQPNQTLLREHEIAVLLAYAKIKPDNGDTMTPAQLVKHRIKPAVLGRSVARTPGILQHIHQKFEKWALGPFTDSFCDMCVTTFGPSQYLPGTDELPTTLPDIGDSIRQCADAHANNMLKTWAGIITSILDIENDTTSLRAQHFEEKLKEKRKFMYQQIFIKISEYWFNLTQQTAYVPNEQSHENLHYRANPNPIAPADDGFLFMRERSGSQLAEIMRKLITTTPPHRSIASWSTVTAHVTIFELHRPSRYGQAGLDFVNSDDIRTNVVKVMAKDTGSTFEPSKTIIRIGSFNSRPLMIEVCGVPPSQMCRALRLELSIGVLPPKPGASRPRFQITDIQGATWVELEHHSDQCVEREPVTELGMDSDEKDDEDAKDRLHQWCVSSGIGRFLALGTGVHWETFDLCEGMTKHDMEIAVPEDILRRVRMHGKVAEQTRKTEKKPGVESGYGNYFDYSDGISYSSCASIDMDVDMAGSGTETFNETCWIDCHTGAKITYMAPAGIELYAATPKKSGIFANAPYWKSRTP